MRRTTRLLLTVVLILTALTGGTILGLRILRPRGPVPEGIPTPPPEGDQWVNLLDDVHASGWLNVSDDKEIFGISDGTVHIFGRTLYPLRYVGYTSEQFENFDLHIEFKLAPGANSGVFLRAHPQEPLHRGFEVQVLEDHGEPPNKNSCGAIYDVVTPMFNMSRPAGEWNSYDISVSGLNVVVRMNGWKIIDTDFAQMTSPLGKFEEPYAEIPNQGHLLLQDHGGEVWYRNILVRSK